MIAEQSEQLVTISERMERLDQFTQNSAEQAGKVSRTTDALARDSAALKASMDGFKTRSHIRSEAEMDLDFERAANQR